MAKHNRFLEILPGALSWGTLILPIFLSLWWPNLVASLILLYVLYWFFKMIAFSTILLSAFRQYRRDVVLDWQAKLEEAKLPYKKVIQLVVLATYKEELPIVEASVEALVKSKFPTNQIWLVLATEARDHERAARVAARLKAKFGKQLGHFWVTEHPADIPGEVKGKGSNISYAAHATAGQIAKLAVSPSDIYVTTLDADHRVHPQYFSALTYAALTDPEPEKKTFQPIPMYFNNIWEVPVFTRMLAFGSSFWQMIESVRSYRLRNFASQSQSYAALMKTDFWSTETIVEDGHQYWRSYFTFKGDYGVVPIFVPIYYDAVLAENLRSTFVEQYLQRRRWAWGVSDIPYVLPRLWRMTTISVWEKLVQTGRLMEGYHSWATASLVLAVIGWMPVWLNHDFGRSVFGANFPLFYRLVLSLSSCGLIVALSISTLLLRPMPRRGRWRQIALDWILTPILTPFANIIFGSVPALDAQTRLMLGKYLEFRVTVKHPVEREQSSHA